MWLLLSGHDGILTVLCRLEPLQDENNNLPINFSASAETLRRAPNEPEQRTVFQCTALWRIIEKADKEPNNPAADRQRDILYHLGAVMLHTSECKQCCNEAFLVRPD